MSHLHAYCCGDGDDGGDDDGDADGSLGHHLHHLLSVVAAAAPRSYSRSDPW